MRGMNLKLLNDAKNTNSHIHTDEEAYKILVFKIKLALIKKGTK